MQPGDTIHRFRILSMLGRGGMAEVYLAAVPGPGGFEKRVALKLPLPHLAEDPEVTAMFIDEARLAAQLDHRNIAATLELGEADGRHYIAMEYVRGISSARLLQHVKADDARLPAHVALFIASEIAAGLQYAHDATDVDERPLNIVHRDVTPSNILLGTDGDVKLVDFGIAKAAYRTKHTVRQLLKGKLSYMAPEQANLEDVGPTADQFALGSSLFEMLTGGRLYEGEHELELLDKARAAETDLLGAHEGLSDATRPVLGRMLQRDPAARYGSLAETREALLAALAEIDPSGSEDTRRKELGSLVRVAARRLGDAAGLPTPQPQSSIPPTRPLDLSPSSPTEALQDAAGRPAWRAFGTAIAVLALVAVVYGVVQRFGQTPQTAAPGDAVYVLPWNVSGTGRELSGLTTVGPGILGKRLVRSHEVDAVFWFRYREMRTTAPTLPPGVWVVEASARVDGDAAAVTIRLKQGDRVIREYDVDIDSGNAIPVLGDVGDRIVSELGATPSEIPDTDMPFGALRIHQAGIRALPAGNRLDSLPTFAQGVKDYPDVPNTYMWAGMVSWWLGPHYLGFLESLTVTARQNELPDYVPELLEIMAGFVQDGHVPWRDRALAASEARPDDPFALFLAGEANVHTGNVREGIAQLDRVRELDPTILLAETHPFNYALIQGDSDRLARIIQIRRSDPTDIELARMDFERLVSLRQYDEAIKLGLAEFDAGGIPRELVSEVALALALQGEIDRAEHLLSEEEGPGIDSVRSVQAAGMSTALIAGRKDLYNGWVERASTARFTGTGLEIPVAEYRLMTQGRVISLLEGSQDPRWRKGMERLQPQVVPLSSQDRRALFIVQTLEAWRGDDTAALDQLSRDERADPIVRHFARGLYHEVKDEPDAARTSLEHAMDSRLAGRYTVVLAHALARVAHAQEDRKSLLKNCDEILRPRSLSIYLGPPVSDCRRWTQSG